LFSFSAAARERSLQLNFIVSPWNLVKNNTALSNRFLCVRVPKTEKKEKTTRKIKWKIHYGRPLSGCGFYGGLLLFYLPIDRIKLNVCVFIFIAFTWGVRR